MSAAGAGVGTVPVDAVLAGHNRISTQALTTVTQAAAAELFGVQPSDVRVSFSDEAGRLAISLATPVAVPGLASLLTGKGKVPALGGSIWNRTIAAKKSVLDKVGYLTGSHISRVDIRVTSVKLNQDGGAR